MALQLDKKRIAQCFRRSLPTYDKTALVQNALAVRLDEMLAGLPDRAFHRVLEIGCCTGGLSELVCYNHPLKTLFLNDLVPEFEELVFRRLAMCCATRLIPFFGDIEAMTLPSELSLIVSGATFQWLTDLPSFLHRLGAGLQSGAFLGFSVFGRGTLKEFSSLTSVALQYHSEQEIRTFLKKQFVVESCEHYEDQLFFPSIHDIFSHIRSTGVGGVSEYQWNKERLHLFKERYFTEYACEKGLPVSYHSSCYVARKR